MVKKFIGTSKLRITTYCIYETIFLSLYYNQLKKEIMKKFLVKSNHIVHVDSFEDGELGYVNGYDVNAFITAENVDKAIEKYFSNTLYYEFDKKHSNIEEGFLEYSVLVDSDNNTPTEHEIELWKKGEIILYSNYIKVSVFELTKVDII